MASRRWADVAPDSDVVPGNGGRNEPAAPQVAEADRYRFWCGLGLRLYVTGQSPTASGHRESAPHL